MPDYSTRCSGRHSQMVMIKQFLRPNDLDIVETLFIDDVRKTLDEYSRLDGKVHQFKNIELLSIILI